MNRRRATHSDGKRHNLAAAIALADSLCGAKTPNDKLTDAAQRSEAAFGRAIC
jgi:hypothetical protein